MDGRFHPLFSGGRFFGGFFLLLAFALFVGVAVWALMRVLNHDGRAPLTHAPSGPLVARDEAIRAARMRYARGELDREQYFRLVEDLTGVPRPPDPAQPWPAPAPAPVSPPPAFPEPPPARGPDAPSGA